LRVAAERSGQHHAHFSAVLIKDTNPHRQATCTQRLCNGLRLISGAKGADLHVTMTANLLARFGLWCGAGQQARLFNRWRGARGSCVTDRVGQT